MQISSRTPEGQPSRCTVCGTVIVIEPSRPPGDAPCPACGALLWFEKPRLTHPVWMKPPVEASPASCLPPPVPLPEPQFEAVSPTEAAQVDAFYAALDVARKP